MDSQGRVWEDIPRREAEGVEPNFQLDCGVFFLTSGRLVSFCCEVLTLRCLAAGCLRYRLCLQRANVSSERDKRSRAKQTQHCNGRRLYCKALCEAATHQRKGCRNIHRGGREQHGVLWHKMVRAQRKSLTLRASLAAAASTLSTQNRVNAQHRVSRMMPRRKRIVYLCGLHVACQVLSGMSSQRCSGRPLIPWRLCCDCGQSFAVLCRRWPCID